MPHPQGDITVEYTRDVGHLSADIELPGILSGSFDWQGQRVALHPGKQHLEL